MSGTIGGGEILNNVGCGPAGEIVLVNLEQMTAGPLPLIAGGAGTPLLYLSGLLPVAGVSSPLAKRTAEYSARPFSDVRRVLYANRRTGLPRGMTIAEIAAEHAETISALNCGPVDVLGVSTGGSIAQQLAADHPGSVQRLVLVSTGCRLPAKTRRMQAQVAQHIRAGHREQALASMIAGVLIPHGEPLAGLLSPFLTRLGKRLGDLGDLATTIEAEDSFDLASCEGTIQAPTLILAGARDRFYPQPLLQETQMLIPGSVLRVIHRRGHMTVMTGSRWSSIVRAHLQ